jgi:porphobilinogen deaminase
LRLSVIFSATVVLSGSRVDDLGFWLASAALSSLGFSSSALRAWAMAPLTPPVSAGALGISARARLSAVAAAFTSPFCNTI